MNDTAERTIESITNLEPLPVQDEVPYCFACGRDNPHGLKLRFYRVNDTTLGTEFTPPMHWCGWGQMMHGGFHGLLLDEIMSWVAYGLMKCNAFVTKKMTVEYLRPIHVGRTLTIIGYLEHESGREIHTRGEIRDSEGIILTVSHATLVRIDPNKMKDMLKS